MTSSIGRTEQALQRLSREHEAKTRTRAAQERARPQHHAAIRASLQRKLRSDERAHAREQALLERREAWLRRSSKQRRTANPANANTERVQAARSPLSPSSDSAAYMAAEQRRAQASRAAAPRPRTAEPAATARSPAAKRFGTDRIVLENTRAAHSPVDQLLHQWVPRSVYVTSLKEEAILQRDANERRSREAVSLYNIASRDDAATELESRPSMTRAIQRHAALVRQQRHAQSMSAAMRSLLQSDSVACVEQLVGVACTNLRCACCLQPFPLERMSRLRVTGAMVALQHQRWATMDRPRARPAPGARGSPDRESALPLGAAATPSSRRMRAAHTPAAAGEGDADELDVSGVGLPLSPATLARCSPSPVRAASRQSAGSPAPPVLSSPRPHTASPSLVDRTRSPGAHDASLSLDQSWRRARPRKQSPPELDAVRVCVFCAQFFSR